MKLGATGEFPRGKLNADDLGELVLAVGKENGCVRIDFGKHIDWLALPPDQAIAFAAIIAGHAMDLQREKAGCQSLEPTDVLSVDSSRT